MKQIFIHLYLLIFSITTISAQTTLKGTVVDAKTKLIISYTGYEKTVIENPFEFMAASRARY